MHMQTAEGAEVADALHISFRLAEYALADLQSVHMQLERSPGSALPFHF